MRITSAHLGHATLFGSLRHVEVPLHHKRDIPCPVASKASLVLWTLERADVLRDPLCNGDRKAATSTVSLLANRALHNKRFPTPRTERGFDR